MTSRDRFQRAAWELLRYLRRPEFYVLAAGTIAVTLAWGFASLAVLVQQGGTASLDQRLLLSLRSPEDRADPLGPPWVEELGRDATALGGAGVLLLLIAVAGGALWLHGMHRAALYVAASSLGAICLTVGLKAAFGRPRPDLAPHGSHVYLSSFPSGHSMISTAVYLTLGMLIASFVDRRRLKVYCMAVALLIAGSVGVSRVYLAVHWPSDVLAGWMVGAAWALGCWTLATWLKQRGMLDDGDSHHTEKLHDA